MAFDFKASEKISLANWQQEAQLRRKKLQQTYPDAVFFLLGSKRIVRNLDVHFPFRQESQFYYLTLWPEPSAWMLLSGSNVGAKFELWVEPKDPISEIWEGERIGLERAKAEFGADGAYSCSMAFDAILAKACLGAKEIFVDFSDAKALAQVQSVLKDAFGRKAAGRIPVLRDIREPLGQMRLIKSPLEIEALRAACHVSAKAHNALSMVSWNEATERLLQSQLEFEFQKSGSDRLGYGSIVAGGKNATCLHYTKNNEKLDPSSLVLVDAGTEIDYYTADITRTFQAVKGKGSQAAKDLYALVLEVQKAAVQSVGPGALLSQIHLQVCLDLAKGLMHLGWLPKSELDINNIGEFKALKTFYPHGTSHYLGMDVHDPCPYRDEQNQEKPLCPGMVLTIEPGLYFQTYDEIWDKEIRGIGIRIEDDCLVTLNGVDNLSKEAHKELEQMF